MSEKGGRDGSGRRLSSRRSSPDDTLPQEYLDQLEERRKQLDESIHKYIAAKEREYKVFQKEIRLQYKLSQGQDGRVDGVRNGNAAHVGQDAALADNSISAIDALSYKANRSSVRSSSPNGTYEESSPGSPATGESKSANDSAKDSVGREKDLSGLFTPDYLHALNANGEPKSHASSSAPYTSQGTDSIAKKPPTECSNSDSSVQTKPERPTQLPFVQRTSSSGSSVDLKLASALRSSTGRPKRKRVSLAVGDSIVAPSDSVPPALSQHTTSSHSRKRSPASERTDTAPMRRTGPAGPSLADQSTSYTALDSPVDPLTSAHSEGPDSQSIVNRIPPAITTGASPTKSYSGLDPDGDLFDLDHVEETDGISSLAQMNSDDSDGDVRDDADLEEDENRETPRSPPIRPGGRTRYDSTEGLIPEPEDGKPDGAVPHLSFGPSSAIAPSKPGFRSPGAIQDPIYIGRDYGAAERNAVDNEVYGSSFSRPASKGSFTPGSLGESYMAQHAEEMMKMRMAGGRAHVKS